jgi:transposase
MIDFQTYMQIRHLADQGLKGAQIARTLELDERTVVHWIEQKTYQPVKRVKKASKLDPYKGQIVRMLESHPYSAQQIFQRLAQEGYGGSYGIVKEFVRHVRPAPRPAFLSLYFEPGQCAQVDWGHAGLIQVGSAKRHLSFFVMVLAYSRRMYVEFTLSQSQEHWLACHLHAWSYFNGVSAQVMVDNCKTAVLSHALGQTPVLNPRYLDFAQHYGFQIKACGPKKPHEKGRVEDSRTQRKMRERCKICQVQRPGGAYLHRTSRGKSSLEQLGTNSGRCSHSWHNPQAGRRAFRPGKAFAAPTARFLVPGL